MMMRRLRHLAFLLLVACLGSTVVNLGLDAPATAAEMARPLNVNTASALQLKAIPGISGADADKIVRGRPYKQTEELVKRGIIPRATYDKIKDKIVAEPR
jgi:competence protein ComEA